MSMVVTIMSGDMSVIGGTIIVLGHGIRGHMKGGHSSIRIGGVGVEYIISVGMEYSME